ncbi:MAG: hypothetical protein VX008_12705 [Pseudomonadota bacterium]|nr:hypothetical protein [Pseudomonadota bacterium]
MSSREESKEIAFLLKNGDWAFPVKVESEKTGNLSFRSAPKDVNKFGFDWNNNEVEVSEVEMIDDVLNKGRRTRCTSTSQPDKANLRGKSSRDVVGLSIGTLIDPPICGVLDPLKTVFFVLKQSDYFLLCAPRPV